MARIDEHGERIPLTVADFNVANGTVTVVIQAVGKTTFEMLGLREGDTILDFIGPLGLPSHIRNLEGTVVLVGGGLGVAPVYPQARAYHERGAYVIGVIGFRNKDLVFWEDKFRAVCDEFIVCSDDGSVGMKGLVTAGIEVALSRHADIEQLIAIGPPIMMRGCAEVTRPHKTPTIVSLNPIMVDGTGMCGGCRVKVGDRIRFACVEGPEFDAHQVDFEDLMFRLQRFKPEEKAALERWQQGCRMEAEVHGPSARMEAEAHGRSSGGGAPRWS